MTAYLLDVNVLVALLWPPHEAHRQVVQWFGSEARKGWATCGLTQAGFVRILSNPAFSSQAPSPRRAMELLAENLDHPGHRFWGDSEGFLAAAAPFSARITGHRQVTDAFLLGLALRHKGKLATLDRGVASLILPETAQRAVEVIA